MKRLITVSFLITISVSCLLLVVPMYRGQTETASSGGMVSITHTTYLQKNGPWFLIVLMIPILISLIPVLVPNRGITIIAAVIFSSLALMTVSSIGMFYLPSAGMLIAASFLRRHPRGV